MIIGVDAGSLAISDSRLHVGVFHITKHLLEYLLHTDTKNTYKLFSFASLSQSIDLSERKNTEQVILSPSFGYMHLRTPLELMRKPVDVFLGVSQAIPRTRAKTIGFIYDLGFLEIPEGYRGSRSKLQSQTEYIARCANYIISISRHTKTQISETYHIDPRNITVSYLGVDRIFTPKGKRYVHTQPYILFVGSLKKQKNVPVLVEAFARIRKKVKKPYELLLVGSNYWEDEFIKMTIKKYSLESTVHLLGQVHQDKLPPYYRGAELFCSPSLVEGFCMPVVEAMACGTPVIVSDRGALPEVVGDAGALVPAMDSTALSNEIDSVLNNSKRRRTMIQRGLIRSKLYTWENFGHSVLQIINACRP